MIVQSVLCAFAFAQANMQVVDIPVKYRTPSELVRMSRGFPHPGASIEAVDENDYIHFVGSAADCAALREWVALMDVAPARITLVIQVENSFNKHAIDLTTTLDSNTTFTFDDSSTKAKVSITPAYRNDHAIELKIVSTSFGHGVSTNLSVKPNEACIFSLGAPKNSNAGKAAGKTDVILKITPRIAKKP